MTPLNERYLKHLWSFDNVKRNTGHFKSVTCVLFYTIESFIVQPVSVIWSYQGVAMGVGLCANSHLEGTLAKLEEFGKSDAFKKSPSIFNLLKVPNKIVVI